MRLILRSGPLKLIPQLLTESTERIGTLVLHRTVVRGIDTDVSLMVRQVRVVVLNFAGLWTAVTAKRG